MSFIFEQTTANFNDSNEIKKQNFLFTIRCKKDRKRFSTFLKHFQFKASEMKIKLSCFPRVQNYHKYNSYNPDGTLRTDVMDTVKSLTMDGYFVVAEVSLVI